MAEIVYVLCAMMSTLCATLLCRGYLAHRSRLLLWSCLCFGFLALNNLVLFVDMMLVPDMDISGALWRNLLSAAAGSLLLFGLIWEAT